MFLSYLFCPSNGTSWIIYELMVDIHINIAYSCNLFIFSLYIFFFLTANLVKVLANYCGKLFVHCTYN